MRCAYPRDSCAARLLTPSVQSASRGSGRDTQEYPRRTTAVRCGGEPARFGRRPRCARGRLDVPPAYLQAQQLRVAGCLRHRSQCSRRRRGRRTDWLIAGRDPRHRRGEEVRPRKAGRSPAVHLLEGRRRRLTATASSSCRRTPLRRPPVSPRATGAMARIEYLGLGAYHFTVQNTSEQDAYQSLNVRVRRPGVRPVARRFARGTDVPGGFTVRSVGSTGCSPGDPSPLAAGDREPAPRCWSCAARRSPASTAKGWLRRCDTRTAIPPPSECEDPVRSGANIRDRPGVGVISP
jgi:hypothetical protein